MSNLVLLTGANGALGQTLSSQLKLSGFDVIEGSSKPNASQLRIDFSRRNSEYFINERLFAVIHVAKSNNLDDLENELDFIRHCCKVSKRFIAIGSISEYSQSLTEYGLIKRKVTKNVLEEGGAVLTCGLINGEGFRGQIHLLSKILRLSPITPQFKSNPTVFLTDIEVLKFSIFTLLQQFQEGQNYGLFDPASAISFNSLILGLSRRTTLKVSLDNDMMVRWIAMLEFFLPSFFKADRFKGLQDFTLSSSLKDLNFEFLSQR